MSARRKLVSYFEPWQATVDPGWKTPYQFGPPSYSSVDPDEREILLAEWEGQKGRAEKNANWIIWGSRMGDVGPTKNLMSIPGFDMGRKIIALSRHLDWPEGSPSHQEVAERIAACVSAMAGIGNPSEFIQEVRSLLLDLAKGEFCDDPRESPRIWGLLSRCLPPEEIEAFNAS
jgi:hypothetical protein